MSRSQSVLTVLVATLALAAVAYLVPPQNSVVANETQPAADQSAAAPWLPEGLVLTEPEMALGVEGAMRDLNAQLSKDLRPADNAAVLLVQVYGEEVFESTLRAASFEMLGILRLADAPRIQYVAAFVRSHSPADGNLEEQADQIAEGLTLGIQQPWSRDDYPSLAEFLDANSDALDLVVVAADRPRYFAPLLSVEDPLRLMSASFAVEFRMPFIARCLAARALNRFSEGDMSAAITDLLACHKLAVLLAHGSSMDISCAKAHSVDALASHAEMAMLTSGTMQPDQAAALLAALKEAPQLPTSEEAADRGERAILHDELELLATDEESRRGYLESGSPEDLQQLKRIVRNSSLMKLIIETADAQQDKMVRALSIRPRTEQYAEFKVLDEEYAKWSSGEPEVAVPFAELAATDPEAVARSIGLSMAMALRTNGWQRRHTDDRARLRRDAALIGLALIAYHGEHGEYPAELSSLAPEFLAEVPADVFADAPFDYERRAADNVVVTSLGANQAVDAGSIYNDDLIIELR